MVRVHLSIQHVHARHSAHGCDDGIDLRGVSSFGKIWHAFNQSFHLFGFLSRRPGQLFGSFGFLSGSVGRSYTNTGLFGLLGAPATWPAGAEASVFTGTRLIACGAGLMDFFTDLPTPGN